MPKKLETMDAETLMTTPLEPLKFIVSGVLPQGIRVLAGSPKIGKSWLALWICLQVAKGEKVWEFSILYNLEEDMVATQAQNYGHDENAGEIRCRAFPTDGNDDMTVESCPQNLPSLPSAPSVEVETVAVTNLSPFREIASIANGLSVASPRQPMQLAGQKPCDGKADATHF